MSNFIEDDNRVNELHDKWAYISKELVKLAELAKQYYNETELKEYGEIFKKLNIAYCDAGAAISRAHAEICEKQIDVWLDVMNLLKNKEGS